MIIKTKHDDFVIIKDLNNNVVKPTTSKEKDSKKETTGSDSKSLQAQKSCQKVWSMRKQNQKIDNNIMLWKFYMRRLWQI